MSLGRTVIVCVLLLGLAATAKAQLPQFQAQVFGEEYGLGGGLIIEVFKDHDQFVWCATASVLQRFDGRNVQNYPFPEPISYSLCAADGRIWVLAGQKLWRSRPELDDFEPLPFDTSGGNWLRGMFQMRTGPVHLLTLKGLYAWDARSSAFVLVTDAVPVPRGRHHMIRTDTCAEQLFYTAKNGQVCALNMRDKQARSLPFPSDVHILEAFTPDLALLTDYTLQSYWLDFAKGEVRPVDAQKYGLSKQFKAIGIRCAAQLGQGRFLVSTRFGLYEYDLGSDRFSPQRIYAGGRPIENDRNLNRLFIDQEGTAWMHNENSLLAMKPSAGALGLLRNYHFDGEAGQWENRVFGFADDGRGNIWFGGMSGFKKLNLKTGAVTVYPHVEGATDRLNHHMVRGVVWDGRHIILGPTNRGVWLFDPLTERFRRPVYARDSVRECLEGEFIDYIGTMRNGDHIVCGRFFAYRMEANSYRTDFLHFPGDKDNMNTVFQDSGGRVWFGSERGLHFLDESYRFLFNVPLKETAPVYCIFETKKGEYLVGARTGLLRLNLLPDGSHRMAPVSAPFDGFELTNIYRDSLRRFWLSTYDGLYLADEHLTSFKRFDFADNIQSKIFNPGTCLRAGNGLLFLGGLNGLNYFFPEKIDAEPLSLSVSIRAVSGLEGSFVLHQPVNDIQLPFGQNTFDVEVVAPYYNNAGKILYRYRLLGLSGEWIDCGNKFRIADLPPGQYKLQVAASLNGSMWHQSEKSIGISILPAFWQTWWFLLLTVSLLLGIIAFLVFYRENRLRDEQNQRLEMEKLRGATLQHELEIEQVVNYFNRSISGKDTVEEVLWDVAQQCISRLGWEDCVIYLRDPERDVLLQKAAWGQKSTPDQKIVSPIEIPIGQGIVGTVAATGRAELVADTTADPRYIVDNAVRRAELAVPLIVDDRVVGVIDSEHSQKGFFTQWHLQILTAIAALCSNRIALANIERAREEVRRQLEEKEKSLLQAEKNAAHIRLMALTNHLNPHFLFNSLTSLNSLIFENQTLASDFLQHLSKVYRYLLQHKDRETVSLKNELDFVENYIFLLKTRFQDEIQIDIETENGVLDKQVVPVTLQILIENAVKHNIISAKQPLHISIRAKGDTLRVSNNMQHKKQVETSNRQGLDTLRALYRYLSDRPIQIADDGTTFCVTLPLIP
jgi:Putative regulator of cell autolysis